MLFDDISGLARVAIVALLAYASLVVVLRFAGKRSLAKLNAFDLVVTVALGSILATVLLSADVVFLEGLLAFVVLAVLQWVVSRLSVASPTFRKMVRSRPRLLIEDGQFLKQSMRDERITEDEVLSVIRGSGIGRIEDVGAVVLETDGSMSVIPRTDAPMTVLGNVRQ